MVPTRVTGPLWIHAGGCRTHIVDLDLQVLSPCLTEAGGGGGAGCRSPREDWQEPRLLYSQDSALSRLRKHPGGLGTLLREMAASSRLWGGRGSASEPKCYPFAPVNFVVVLGLPGGGLLGVVPSPFPSVWARNIRAQQQDLHTGAGQVGSRALICDPSLVPGVASAGKQGGGLGCSCMSWTIPAS